ncbi:hypothetical protein DWY99_10655 [[Clostridium] leptum]|uniref:Uncharacterized protein n=1 Tax=[Clostridium] leptum TaxID=1535 RepID=A0A412AVN8_9FIRM|nr:hypothetical protein DWY99_10655 [[Clostridium] leptum]
MMLIQPEKVALVKVRLRKAVRRCEKLWIRFVSASAKGLKNAEKWALRILKRAEDWLEKLLAQAVKEKIKAAFTQECRSRKAVNLVMPVACVLVLASVLSLVPLAPRAAAADHEPAAETANLTITLDTPWRRSRKQKRWICTENWWRLAEFTWTISFTA